LNVKTVIGRGFFTDYHDGVSGIPMRFVDYIVYPDKERTEFSGGGQRLIQTNTRNSGWIYDGAALTLKDQTAAQLEDFRLATRTGLEALLRGGWRTAGAKLTYVGRREQAWDAATKLCGLLTRMVFGSNTSSRRRWPAREGPLPTQTEKPDSARWKKCRKKIECINDHHRRHRRSIRHRPLPQRPPDSRINYESVEFNKTIAESLFASRRVSKL